MGLNPNQSIFVDVVNKFHLFLDRLFEDEVIFHGDSKSNS